MLEVDLEKIIVSFLIFSFSFVSLSIQVFQLLGATYARAVKFPNKASECGNTNPVIGAVEDNLIKAHNGSMIVSVRIQRIFSRKGNKIET